MQGKLKSRKKRPAAVAAPAPAEAQPLGDAFLAIDGKRDGFCAWHKLVLAALWLVPLIARSVAETVSVPLAAPVMILAFIFVLQRAMSAGSGLEGDGALADESLK